VGFFDWSETPGSNGNASPGVTVAEGVQAKLLNDAVRNLMADLAKWRKDISGSTLTTGSASALTLTTSSSIPSYSQGLWLAFRAHVDVLGGATLSVDGKGGKRLYRTASELIDTGDIKAGDLYDVVYFTFLDGGNGGWRLISQTDVVKTSGSQLVQVGGNPNPALQANKQSVDIYPHGAVLIARPAGSTATDILFYGYLGEALNIYMRANGLLFAQDIEAGSAIVGSNRDPPDLEDAARVVLDGDGRVSSYRPGSDTAGSIAFRALRGNVVGGYMTCVGEIFTPGVAGFETLSLQDEITSLKARVTDLENP
jgi:hypothetical protein